MLLFPNFNPIAFSLGPLDVHWYGLMYLLGFCMAWGLAVWRTKHYQLAWSDENIGDLVFFAALGVIIGGRLGYLIFYKTSALLNDPLFIFKLWEGGMSFHGGLIGVLFSLYFFSRRIHKSFLEVLDFTAPLVPLGLAAGRLGNFINGELWGRVTNVPWAVIFPAVDDYPRHPSQLYELILEGPLLFMIIWLYARKKRPTGRVSSLFLMGYAVLRMVAECFREPDAHRGYLAFNCLTEGQLLSLPLLFFGLYLWWSKRDEHISTVA
jgi:phosphatidylglycerol---prolipoprotein diacylglyceryl transferase